MKKNYNANTHKEFVKLFKKNYKKKILFSSFKSEQLFINFLNIDFNFLLEKYQESYPIKILNFFISRKKFYFNYCHYSNNNKHTHNYKHVKDICCCNIKVKSIVNLPIESLVFILKQNFHKNKSINDISTTSQLLSSHILIENKLNTSLSISNDTNKQINDIKLKQPKIIKVAKNNDTKDLIKCLYNLEKANDKLGLDIIDNHYTIDSESINNYENNIDNYMKNEKNEKNNYNNIISKFDVEESKSSEIFNHNKKLKTTNIEHANQFSSESINVFNEKIKAIHNETNNNINIKCKFESESNYKSNEKSSNKSSNKSNEELNNKSNEELNNKSSEESSDKSSEESSDKSSDKSSEESSEESSDKSSEESSEESSDKTSEESSEESSDKTSEELKYNNNFNQLSKKNKIKKCIDMMIKKLQTNNNILFKDNNINRLCMGLKKIIKEEYPIDMASKFDRLYQKIILINKISDTEDMEKYGNLMIQLNEFKNLL